MNVLIDLLMTITGLRVILYGIVVSTIALGVLCMTVLIVGWAPHPSKAHRLQQSR